MWETDHEQPTRDLAVSQQTSPFSGHKIAKLVDRAGAYQQARIAGQDAAYWADIEAGSWDDADFAEEVDDEHEDAPGAPAVRMALEPKPKAAHRRRR
ncbi:MAG TPA: hypothetical protein VKE22_27765 [Haliangiales bacterium]|nr:hypothetical protein [Haliangiales bacterium]